MQFCSQCGQGNAEDSDFCVQCGTQLPSGAGAVPPEGPGGPPPGGPGMPPPPAQGGPGAPPPPPGGPPPAPPEGAYPPPPGQAWTGQPAPPGGMPPPGYPQQYRQGPPPDGLAIAALVAGIAGFFFCPVIGGVLAVIFGYMSRRNISESNGALSGDSFATAGIILGFIQLGLVLAGIVIWIIIITAASTHTGMVSPGLMALLPLL